MSHEINNKYNEKYQQSKTCSGSAPNLEIAYLSVFTNFTFQWITHSMKAGNFLWYDICKKWILLYLHRNRSEYCTDIHTKK